MKISIHSVWCSGFSAVAIVTALLALTGCDKDPKGSPGGGPENRVKKGSAANERGINQESSPGGVPNEAKFGPNQIPKSQATNSTEQTRSK